MDDTETYHLEDKNIIDDNNNYDSSSSEEEMENQSNVQQCTQQ